MEIENQPQQITPSEISVILQMIFANLNSGFIIHSK